MKKFLVTEPVVSSTIIRLACIALVAFIIFRVDLGLTTESLIAIVGWLLSEFTTTKVARDNVYQPDSVVNLMTTSFAGNENLFESSVGNYVLELLKKILPAVKIPGVLNLIAPLVAEYVGREFNEKVRGEVQQKLMSMLIKWKLIKAKPKVVSTVSFLPFLSLLSLLPLTLILTGCPALFTPINNALTADGSKLIYTNYGALFDSGPKAALAVIVTIQGDIDSAPLFTAEEDSLTAFRWDAGRVEASQPLPIEFVCGEGDCFVWVTFQRESGDFHEVLPE